MKVWFKIGLFRLTLV